MTSCCPSTGLRPSPASGISASCTTLWMFALWTHSSCTRPSQRSLAASWGAHIWTFWWKKWFFVYFCNKNVFKFISSICNDEPSVNWRMSVYLKACRISIKVLQTMSRQFTDVPFLRKLSQISKFANTTSFYFIYSSSSSNFQPIRRPIFSRR